MNKVPSFRMFGPVLKKEEKGERIAIISDYWTLASNTKDIPKELLGQDPDLRLCVSALA